MMLRFKERRAKRKLSKMLNINPAKGKFLDNIAAQYGEKRFVYWWVFKESDRAFRERIVNRIKH